MDQITNDSLQHFKIIFKGLATASGIVNDDAGSTQTDQRKAHCHAMVIVGFYNRGFWSTWINSNRRFCFFSRAPAEEGVDLTYEEHDGKHDWVFWDTQIRKVLEWLPLNDAKAGLSSGNISV